MRAVDKSDHVSRETKGLSGTGDAAAKLAAMGSDRAALARPTSRDVDRIRFVAAYSLADLREGPSPDEIFEQLGVEALGHRFGQYRCSLVVAMWLGVPGDRDSTHTVAPSPGSQRPRASVEPFSVRCVWMRVGPLQP